MAKPGADKVLTQKHRRAWSQRGGPGPVSLMRYAGPSEQYMMFDAADNPVRGGQTPMQVHSTSQRGAYELIGRTVAAPDFPKVAITFLQRHGGISWVDFDLTCPNNFYESAGVCKKPNDFLNGWSDWIKVYSYGEASPRTEDGQTTFSDDNQSTAKVEFTCAAIYKVGALNFGEKAAPEVEREVVDGVYASAVDCGNCGVTDDGTQRLYWVTKSSGAGSPGTPAEVVYTVNGGATWAQTNVTGLGGTVDPTGLKVAGNYLIVLDTAGNGYWFAELNSLTGVPGSWTNVTAGFVAAKQPTDMYVAAPNEIYFSANGGYIYKCVDVPSGVTVLDAGNVNTANYVRIHGQDDCLVVVGESGKIVKSLNRGASWANVTLSPTSATVRAIRVLDDYRYWIGTSGGKVYYTINGGETFVEQSLPGGTYTVIDDIVAATDEVIHISARVSSTARLITTWCGGALWASSATVAQRIQNFPTATRFNRIAVPQGTDATTAANNVALGGLSGGGTDGAIFLGISNKV
jgi:photosystem II stability/assembly factor-like uncharacterized protein